MTTKPCPFPGCPNPAHAAQFCCPACYGALPRADRDSVFHIRRKEHRGELTPAHARRLEQAIIDADRRGHPDPAA